MATLNSKTIGPTGDYATLALWFADCPADLTTADAAGYVYRGRVQNTELVASINITGKTGLDAAHYVELTADTGASFADNASVRTNALRYNAANGASIKSTGDYAQAVIVSQSYTRISRLQLRGGGTTSSVGLTATGTIDYVDVDQCIVEGYTTWSACKVNGNNSRIRNSLVVARGESHAGILELDTAADANNVTLVSVGGVAAAGIVSSYGTCNLSNVYVGNATAITSGTSTFNKTNCYTSVSGPPAGWSAAAFSTDTFESITAGTHDFRLKTGSSLIDAGAVDATYAANDITGLARSGSWDVGAWEVASAGGADATGTATPASITLTAPAGSASGTGGANATGTGSLQSVILTAPAGSATGTTSGAGTITTPVMKNNAGTVLAYETGVTVNVYDASTGALIVQKTGQTSNASGVVTISDALIVPATTYAYEVVLTGARRRLPIASAA